LQTADYDDYFYRDRDEVLVLVVRSFVERLEEPVRTAVQMCLMQGLPYSEAAATISVMRGRDTDPKTVWRWARQGAERLRRMFAAADWVSEITGIPRSDDEPDEGEGHGPRDVGGEEADLPWFLGPALTEPV
jgi:hypothetical protein